jgi:acyl-CoA hydrolase
MELYLGGSVVSLIDEELALYSIIQLENQRVVTNTCLEINFRSSKKQGDIIEIGIDGEVWNYTALNEVRNMMTRETIIIHNQYHWST